MNRVKYFLIILLPALIILINFQYLIYNTNFYQKIFKKIGVYNTFQSHEIVDLETANLLDYFQNRAGLNSNFFSEQAMLHLIDVKNLLNLVTNFLYLTSFAILVSIIILFSKRKQRKIFEAVFASSIITLIATGFLTAGILNYFESIFRGFHLAVFKNNLWLFPESENLIKLFPQGFFVSFANSLVRNIAISSALLALISAIAQKRLSR